MKAQANNIEHRFCGEGLEVRKMDGKKPKVRGYALLYNSVYDMGWFTEEVERGALDKADMSDVRILFNHDQNQILGRTKSGTAAVGLDERGMWYEVEVPETEIGRHVLSAIERGDVDQSSWGFMLRYDDTTNGDRNAANRNDRGGGSKRRHWQPHCNRDGRTGRPGHAPAAPA